MEHDNRAKISDGRWDELEAMAALDLKNAYGMFHRSGAITEICEELPSLKGMVRSQWQNGESKFWMQVAGEWK
eukprot:6812452-Karenia_brevis.AAC.1